MAPELTLSSAIIYSFIGGLLPALFWLIFWLQEDKIHPEPKGVIALAFVAGMGSVAVALHLELLLAHVFPPGVIRVTLWAASEELVKYWAASYAAMRHNKAFDEPVDAMIYLITAALGFAAAENALFIFGAISEFPATVTVLSGSLRFVGASLLHVLASATVGAFIAFSFYKSSIVKFEYILGGLFAATALHTIFNLLILQLESAGQQPLTLAVFSLVWLGIIMLIFFFEKVKALFKS
ncbi:MAG: hypothetical protein COV10_01440 [Candidatus Vogelbacteria bacterium CG10_big_fil_rev_8_21_14_0_10_51_16]|uniref:Protease PrsW n=1 Tax=Candidatus Vogelbacteria bacterium CG10_big_fil_rev_8_21_14_0_10_51_16 TaxID=1975045 RepID=A0A2H0RET5_9BACT|nr:MAG: hypothetical protein COV10_01440 [Candidatus Vogelbacteria bacterium CG10_big_fil_rev_8_21_14_0_10_51_16]